VSDTISITPTTMGKGPAQNTFISYSSSYTSPPNPIFTSTSSSSLSQHTNTNPGDTATQQSNTYSEIYSSTSLQYSSANSGNYNSTTNANHTQLNDFVSQSLSVSTPPNTPTATSSSHQVYSTGTPSGTTNIVTNQDYVSGQNVGVYHYNSSSGVTSP
jgi:hypothetical protein